MTYLRKAGAIIASQAVANVGAGAGWGIGTFIGASLSVYFGINAVVATLIVDTNPASAYGALTLDAIPVLSV